MPEHDLPMNREMRDAIDVVQAENLKQLKLNPETVEPWEDGYRTYGERSAFEWWYFDCQLDDGSNLVVTFNTKPHTEPKGPLRPSVLLIHRTADGVSTKKYVEYTPEEFSADHSHDSSCNVQIGPNWVKGNLESYDLHAEVEGIVVDLHIDRKGPSWRPGAGYNFFNKAKTRYLAWVVPVPYGTVNGKLVIDGDTSELNGSAYHDHNWGNTLMGDMLDHWYWGRAKIGDYSVIYVQMTTAKLFGLGGIHLPVFYLAKGDDIITDDGMSLTLKTFDEVDGPNGQTYPTRFEWTWDRNETNDEGRDPSEYGKITLTVTAPKLIEVLDMTADMPAWKARMIHLFRDPLYYDFDAEATLQIDYKGIKETVEGRTLYEKMMFR